MKKPFLTFALLIAAIAATNHAFACPGCKDALSQGGVANPFQPAGPRFGFR